MILTFGEILLRMSPKLGGEWISNQTMPTFIGGAELNTATALASWELPVSYMTAMPENALAKDMEQYMIHKGIGTEPIVWCGDRVGIYMLPQGADLKNAGVIYDRAHSSFSTLKVGQINWKEVLADVMWLHLSAISPALNQEVADVCLEMVKAAASMGVKVSLDLNYRAKLWKYGKEPMDIVPQIAEHCHLIMGNVWAANKLLGIAIDQDVAVNNARKDAYLEQSIASAEAIKERFKNCQIVANTFRFDYLETGIEYYTTLHVHGEQYVSKVYQKAEVLDKIGSGDCFMAGLLYGFYQNHSPQNIIDFAAAAAIGKLNEYGDATTQKVADVEKILSQN